MIKLSDFKTISKYKFINNILEPIQSKKFDMEEIEIKDIDKEVIDNFSKIFENGKELSNEELLFVSISLLSNVEVDVDYQEFLKMLGSYNNIRLISFCNLIIERISQMVEVGNMIKGKSQEVKLETNKIDNIMSKLKVVK